MKNQIKNVNNWVKTFIWAFVALMFSVSAFAQNPGGGHPPGWPFPPHGGGTPHPSIACNAHFLHFRDSVVNGVQFINIPGSGAATYAWDFGDGSSSTDRNPAHAYADTGFYYVCLTVTDTIHGGCTDTHCDSIHLFTPPPFCNARFFTRRDSVPNEVRFYSAHRFQGPNSTATYSWDFGDGSGSTDRHPVHEYATPGKYLVCLTVNNTNAHGSCSATHCDSVNTERIRHRHHHFRLAGESSTFDKEVQVSIYPNPMVENSTIHIENAEGNVTIKIYGMTGQLALSKILENGDYTINRDELKAGIYFYSVEEGDDNVAKGKLIVN